MPVREPEPPLSFRRTRRAVPEGRNYSRQLVPGSTASCHGRGDRSKSRATPSRSGQTQMHESERSRRLSRPMAGGAPPASSRLSPRPRPSRQSPSSVTSLCQRGELRQLADPRIPAVCGATARADVEPPLSLVRQASFRDAGARVRAFARHSTRVVARRCCAHRADHGHDGCGHAEIMSHQGFAVRQRILVRFRATNPASDIAEVASRNRCPMTPSQSVERRCVVRRADEGFRVVSLDHARQHANRAGIRGREGDELIYADVLDDQVGDEGSTRSIVTERSMLVSIRWRRSPKSSRYRVSQAAR